MKLDETHDPALTSWVESANAPGCDFPIQNLPFGIFRRKGGKAPPRGGSLRPLRRKTPKGRFWIGNSQPGAFADSTQLLSAGSCVSSSFIDGAS